MSQWGAELGGAVESAPVSPHAEAHGKPGSWVSHSTSVEWSHSAERPGHTIVPLRNRKWPQMTFQLLCELLSLPARYFTESPWEPFSKTLC